MYLRCGVAHPVDSDQSRGQTPHIVLMFFAIIQDLKLCVSSRPYIVSYFKIYITLYFPNTVSILNPSLVECIYTENVVLKYSEKWNVFTYTHFIAFVFFINGIAIYSWWANCMLQTFWQGGTTSRPHCNRPQLCDHSNVRQNTHKGAYIQCNDIKPQRCPAQESTIKKDTPRTARPVGRWLRRCPE